MPDDKNEDDLEDDFQKKLVVEREIARQEEEERVKEVPYVDCRTIYTGPENLYKQG